MQVNFGEQTDHLSYICHSFFIDDKLCDVMTKHVAIHPFCGGVEYLCNNVGWSQHCDICLLYNYDLVIVSFH